MKKQTKVFATLSAAALLAVGVSAVSMAAGWDNSTGVWRYLDNNGEAVTDEWKSANGNWFYLDSDGVMATNQLIEDNNNKDPRYYYVDQYGAMVTNTWKAVAMDDSSNTDLDAEYWWYYFGADGKAYTTKSDKKLTASQIKTINGLKYAFDDEGHMLYGWIDEDSLDQQDGDEYGWQESEYYFNGWNDGHMQTGWIKLSVEDDDETKDYWFWFDNKGKKKVGKRANINGLYYHFGSHGQMLDDWAEGTNDKISNGTASTISYLNGDGSERRNQWVWAIPDEDYLKDDYDKDEYSWWYFNKSGKMVKDQVKKINGKKYAFDDAGRMLTQFVGTDNEDKNIVDLGEGDDWTREEWTVSGVSHNDDITQDNDLVARIYYFSNDEERDGSMKKGYQTINLDDGTYQFYFNTSNGRAEGEASKNYYVKKIKKYVVKGLVMAPSSDDDSNYAAFNVAEKKLTFGSETLDNIMVGKSGIVQKSKTKLKDENDAYYVVGDKGQVLKYFDSSDDYDDYFTVKRTVGDKEKTKKITITKAMLASPDSEAFYDAYVEAWNKAYNELGK